MIRIVTFAFIGHLVIYMMGVVLLVFFHADEIVCADAVKAAELDQVFDPQLGASLFNVTVALLRLVDDRANFLLCQTSVRAQGAHSLLVIHLRF